MATVFFSYSHQDEPLRNELEVHLSMLKRQGLIEAWHDRRIPAGSEIDSTISTYLESADIILLLVSPHFIASDYCYDKEMIRAMERQAAGDARVIPVILEYCDWHHAPFGKLLAVPTDGKPVSKYANPNEAMLEVVQAIRKTIEELEPSGSTEHEIDVLPEASSVADIASIRSSNLRVKKEFTDHERDEFLDSTFEYMANYFENSLEELAARNPEITTRFKRIDATHFTSIVYINGQSVSECKVWVGGMFSSGISYGSSAKAMDNGCNEAMNVNDDGYSLFMSPMGMAFRCGPDVKDKQLSQEGAAEYYWSILIVRLQ